ncbi:MAG: hypothetical protein WDN69_04785 [Aliidongia sp.]
MIAVSSCVSGTDIEHRGQIFQEYFDKLRVEMRTRARVDMRHNFVDRPGLLVGPAGQQGVEDIDDGNDAAA